MSNNIVPVFIIQLQMSDTKHYYLKSKLFQDMTAVIRGLGEYTLHGWGWR